MLLELPNSKELGNTYVHLMDLQIIDNDPKNEILVHVILGISDYTKIKSQEQSKVGFPGEPLAEWQSLGGLQICYFPKYPYRIMKKFTA